MAPRSSLEIVYKKAPRGLSKKYKEAREASLKAIAKEWWSTMLPIHFTPEANTEYGFAKRSEKHIKRKQKLHGHNNPLEFSGKTKNIMLGNLPTPKINSKKMDLQFKGIPKYIYYSTQREPSEIESTLNQYDNIWEAQRKLAAEGRPLSLKYLTKVKQGLIKGKNKLPPMRNELVAVSNKEIKELGEISNKILVQKLDMEDKNKTNGQI